jgi:hypothetical protein
MTMPQSKLGTYTSRKIELEMCAAAHDVRDWKSDNTEVKACINQANGLPVSRVYLHGNHIANLQQVRHDEMQLQVIESTLIRWPTATTQSRLRALGADVRQSKRVVYLNGVAITEV